MIQLLGVSSRRKRIVAKKKKNGTSPDWIIVVGASVYPSSELDFVRFVLRSTALS